MVSGFLEKRFAKLFGDRGDHEFRPIALEIIERPASPVAMTMILTIALFFLGAIVWSTVGMVDIVSLAQGKFQPSGRVKTVQPLETGRVTTIRIRNGDLVRAGDVLVTFDAREVTTEYVALENIYFSYLAESQRRTAAILSADVEQLTEPDWDEGVSAQVRKREDGVLSSDFNQIMAQLNAIDATIALKKAERERLLNIIESQQILLETLTERVTLRQKLSDSAVGTRTALIDALETLHQQKTALVSQIGELKEADKALLSLSAERAKTKSAFIADHRSRAADAKRNADDAALKREKVRTRLENFVLRSPIDGIVQALTVTSIGQVLPAAQEAMRIIPENDVLQAEVYVQNKDIGFIREGQEAEVKIEAFPFTRYGVVHAAVKRVARDAISQPEMLQTDVDPSRPYEGRSSGGGQRVQNLVYPVELTLTQNYIEIEGQRVQLMPGMSITAEVKTGKRRLIEYLLSPLAETVSQTARER